MNFSVLLLTDIQVLVSCYRAYSALLRSLSSKDWATMGLAMDHDDQPSKHYRKPSDGLLLRQTLLPLPCKPTNLTLPPSRSRTMLEPCVSMTSKHINTIMPDRPHLDLILPSPGLVQTGLRPNKPRSHVHGFPPASTLFLLTFFFF